MPDVNVLPDDLHEGRARALRLIAASLGGEKMAETETSAVMGEILSLDEHAQLVATAALIHALTLFADIMARLASEAAGATPLDTLEAFDREVGARLEQWRKDNDA